MRSSSAGCPCRRVAACARRRPRRHRARRRRRGAHGCRGRAHPRLRREGNGGPTRGGETVRAERAVVAGVTPTQLYGQLLGSGDVPRDVTRAAARYRYGRGEMQIHLALSELPDWYGDERLARTAIVHVTPGLDGVSRAVNEAERGLLPAEATIVCGQPMAVDPSRAPDGSWIIWIQLQELPAGRVKGDAAGELDVGDGSWTEKLREAYADRIVGAARSSHPESRARHDPKRARALSGGDRGAQRQSRRRRHLRRLVRARPELPVPPARHRLRDTAPPSTTSGTSARRRIPGRVSARAPATSSTRSSRSASAPALARCRRSASLQQLLQTV